MGWNSSIINGGQTGAERAALDFAIKNEISHGGWCPKGRVEEDGALDPKYRLKETPSEDTSERTEWNVRDSDASILFSLAEKPAGGSKKTITTAKKLKKPSLHLHRGMLGVSEKLIAFMDKHHPIRRLNVAGPKESEEPGIYNWVTNILEQTKSTMDRMAKH